MHLRAAGAPGDFLLPRAATAGHGGAPGDFWHPEASEANIFKRSQKKLVTDPGARDLEKGE